MASKLNDYLTLRYLIFGLPKQLSKINIGISVIYILAYFLFSLYKIVFENTDNWIYFTLLIITIITALFLFVYNYMNRSNYQKMHFKNTSSYLTISSNIFRLLFIGSNIVAYISVVPTTNFYDAIAFVFSSIYLVYVIISTIISIVMILIRMINFRQYIPFLKNRKLVNLVANDIRESIKGNN